MIVPGEGSGDREGVQQHRKKKNRAVPKAFALLPAFQSKGVEGDVVVGMADGRKSQEEKKERSHETRGRSTKENASTTRVYRFVEQSEC